MRWLKALVLSVALALQMGGCSSTPVADDVGQREANQIVSILRERGIGAQLVKARGNKGGYSVTVPSARYPEAAGVLTQAGLPSDKKPSFQDLTASYGIIPPSREIEALRIDRAAAAEIEELLKARPDVAGASVLVRARALDTKGPPTASVVVQKRPGSEVDVDGIREITTRAVPGISAQDVLVLAVDASAQGAQAAHGKIQGQIQLVSFLGISHVPASDYQNHVFLFIALSVFVGALAGLSGYLFGQFTLINRQNSGNMPRTQVITAARTENNNAESEFMGYDKQDSGR